MKTIIRYALNGRKYEWIDPSDEKTKKLITKYGIDQIIEKDETRIIWLQS